jgi:hypothetical protein
MSPRSDELIGQGQEDGDTQSADNSRSKSSARVAFTARPSCRACIVADWLPLNS